VHDIPTQEPLAYRPEEAARLLSVGRHKIFDLIRAGELRSVRIGHSRRIPRTAVEEYIEQRLAAEQAAGGEA
jgi:excisionase family DNA binding protein